MGSSGHTGGELGLQPQAHLRGSYHAASNPGQPGNGAESKVTGPGHDSPLEPLCQHPATLALRPTVDL